MPVHSTRILRGTTAALALIALAACGRDRKSDVDAELARDIALAGAVAAQPQFQDTAIAMRPVPETPAAQPQRAPARRATTPTRETPAPAPRRAPRPVADIPNIDPVPAPSPARIEVVSAIGSGTSMTVSMGSRVCTETNRPGDKFVATVTEPVYGSNGAVIPAGSRVVIEIAEASSGDSPESSRLEFRVRSIAIGEEDYPASGSVVATTPLEQTKIAKADPNADKKKVIGGAIAGAILGQIIGKDTKSTVIGAAAGAATGAVVAKAGDRYQSCLPAGSEMRVTLSDQVVLARR
jgi:hypothetical protein